MKIIGLTGASGSGKSTVAIALGVPVVDADKAARVAVQNPECLNKLAEIFGEEILNEDKTLNRKELAKRKNRNVKQHHSPVYNKNYE